MEREGDYLEYLFEQCEELVMEFEGLRDYNLQHAHLLKPSPFKAKEAYLRALESENSQKARKTQLEEERLELERKLRELMWKVEERRADMKRLGAEAKAREQQVQEKSRVVKEKKQLEKYLQNELERVAKEKD
jgi:hypothetical protein